MEFKGTKDWSISRLELSDLKNIAIVSEKENKVICHINNHDNESEDIDVKLMVAAPKLLEACSELLKLLKFHGYENATEIYKAQQAINKALK